MKISKEFICRQVSLGTSYASLQEIRNALLDFQGKREVHHSLWR